MTHSRSIARFTSRGSIPTFLALLLSALPTHAQGTGTCRYKEIGHSTTEYSTNVLKAVFSFGGLFFSTQTCYVETKIRWKYEYLGPPIQLPDPSGAPDPVGFELRLLNAEAKCAGDPVQPTQDMKLGLFRVASLDGQTLDLPATPITGTLPFFLGADFDPSPFDPAALASNAWTGYSVIVPASMASAPTLTIENDDVADIPIQRLLDVGTGEGADLRVALGRPAAGALLVMLVSGSMPQQDSLFRLAGVTVPLAFDDLTFAFAAAFPPLVGIADGNGEGSFSFPALKGSVLDGIDLRIAVLALDASGSPLDASTFVNLGLRDFDQCL